MTQCPVLVYFLSWYLFVVVFSVIVMIMYMWWDVHTLACISSPVFVWAFLQVWRCAGWLYQHKADSMPITDNVWFGALLPLCGVLHRCQVGLWQRTAKWCGVYCVHARIGLYHIKQHSKVHHGAVRQAHNIRVCYYQTDWKWCPALTCSITFKV